VIASVEVALAALVTLIGIALTSIGVATHTAPAVAPGALLTLVGGAWLGNVLARRDVRLLPGTVHTNSSAHANGSDGTAA
jgi:hypothetical protein